MASVDKETNAKIIVWITTSPSSKRKKVKKMQEQEKNLIPFQPIINSKEFMVNYNPAINASLSLRCHLCQMTSKNLLK